jgi:hypothetical protein
MMAKEELANLLWKKSKRLRKATVASQKTLLDEERKPIAPELNLLVAKVKKVMTE